VSGETFRHLDDPDVSLVVGEDGVSVVTMDGPATVRFDECVAMETRPDGARNLTGADGFRVRVEPTLFAGLTQDVVAARIDARLSRELVVPLPPREPDGIPQPTERVRPSAAARISRLSAPVRRLLRRAGDAVYAQARRWSLSRVGYWLMWLAGFAGVQFGWYAVRILGAIRRGESDAVAAAVILGALCVVLVGTLLYVTVRALLEVRRARGSRRR
jgi:hypothetical protein